MVKKVLLLLIVLPLASCSRSSSDSDILGRSSVSASSLSVMGMIRPKADPMLVAKIRQEEIASQQARLKADNAVQNNGESNPAMRDLPPVICDPISGGKDRLSDERTTQTQEGLPKLSDLANKDSNESAKSPAQQAILEYGSAVNASVVPSSGLIPPPPAITLSTQAQTVAYAGTAVDPSYGHPYANPYFNPYYPYMMQPPAGQQAPMRPPGSLFGNAKSLPEVSEAEPPLSSRNKKVLEIITPCGMEPRSPYKQRDDLRILWKGAQTVSTLNRLISANDKLAKNVAKVDVGLPAEASKGALSLSQRQIDNLFKASSADKKATVFFRKAQAELAQAYYRYLYAYNKFSLAQQHVAARKQEVEVAESAAEKQRAATDLASAQGAADESKEDLKAAQGDLAAASGAAAARSIIARVSGIAPSIESLAADADVDSNEENSNKGNKFLNAMSVKGLFGSMTSAFGFGKSKPQAGSQNVSEQSAQGDNNEKLAEAIVTKNQNNKKKGQKKTGQTKPEKNNKATIASRAETVLPVSKPAEGEGVKTAANSSMQGPAIIFSLKDVKTTPRKSMLKVSIRNTGTDSFSFDPEETVAVCEGEHKLSEAAVRAEFDTTVVQPNSEIIGTITIFGRPWNDKLSVVLADGSKTIRLHR